MNPEQFKSVTTVDDNYLITAFGAARRRIVLMAPGVSGRVAEGLAQAWEHLGGNAVSVILDVDPEVCRLGYGDEQGLTRLQEIATRLGQALCHEPGTRIGLLIVDDRTVIYSPTPLLIESQPDSSAEPEVGSLFPARPRPNGIVLGEPPAQLANELGAGPDGAESRSLGLDSVQSADMAALKSDLANNPPLKFDVARYERVFNARIEFVELKMQGCAVSKHTASIPSDLMGLAGDAETGNRLRANFKVIGEGDTVDEAGELSEKALEEERKRISDEYLITLPNFGTVILRTNRPAFEKEIIQLKLKVAAFGEGLKKGLHKIIESNVAKLVEALLPRATQMQPKRWKRFVGESPSVDQCRIQLEQDIRGAFGSAEDLIREMKVSLLFKGVTYQTLKDPDFRGLVQQKIPGLELMHEYDAARGEETGDGSELEEDSQP